MVFRIIFIYNQNVLTVKYEQSSAIKLIMKFSLLEKIEFYSIFHSQHNNEGPHFNSVCIKNVEKLVSVKVRK